MSRARDLLNLGGAARLLADGLKRLGESHAATQAEAMAGLIEKAQAIAAAREKPQTVEKPEILPVPLLGGSSPSAILAQGTAIRLAARALLHALASAEPHGRDYRDPKHYQRARAEHIERLRRTEAIARYGVDLCEAAARWLDREEERRAE